MVVRKYELSNDHSGDSKIITDAGKLTREGKDMQDSLVDCNCVDYFPWLFLIIGPTTKMSTLSK